MARPATLLTAFTTLSTLAAQPGATPVPTPVNTRPTPAAPMVAAIPLAGPGTLKGLQSANTVVLAGNRKLNIGVKPGTVDTPVVPATIASLSYPSGASAIAGSATVLTENKDKTVV